MCKEGKQDWDMHERFGNGKSLPRDVSGLMNPITTTWVA